MAMWFNRNKKNRRLGRIQVLDVKLRSGQARQARLRFVARASGVLFSVAFGLFALWRAGEWAANRFIYENPAFAIRRIEARSDGVIPPEQLRRWAGARPGANLIALDLARVKRDLEMVPHVASVSVERILPDTLRIRVTEREAVAQVNVPRARPGGGFDFTVFHLDLEGFVMTPADPRPRTTPPGWTDDSLPCLTGMRPSDLQPGRRADSPAVEAALRLIAEFGVSPMAGLVDLRHIDVSAPETLVVTTSQGAEVTFGFQELDRQLRRWREIHDQGRRMNRNLAFLDLAVKNNIPARWLEASTAQPPAAKPPRPLRNRKNHV
jgi:cell division septal protein FtsQ